MRPLTDPSPSSSESSALEKISTIDVSGDELIRPYQLTVKRGFWALLIMYVCPALIGLGLSFGVKLIRARSNVTDSFDIQMLGMISVLIGGALVLLWSWTDIRRMGSSFLPQIGLQQSFIKTSRASLLILLVLSATHFLAWIYRSVLLPLVDQEGVIGGGSQMFAHIQESGSVIGMIGFLVLALIVGPAMEEVVFRGYLQSALAGRMPGWVAITITSLLFMVGHSPMILWPMYFVYSLAWGWIFLYTGSLKMAIAIHMLSNLIYTVIGFSGWKLLA